MPLPPPPAEAAGAGTAGGGGGAVVMAHCAVMRRATCTGCATRHATASAPAGADGTRPVAHVVYDDGHAEGSPAFFCGGCYAALHYDAQGALVYGGFRVFPYYHERWD